MIEPGERSGARGALLIGMLAAVVGCGGSPDSPATGAPSNCTLVEIQPARLCEAGKPCAVRRVVSLRCPDTPQALDLAVTDGGRALMAAVTNQHEVFVIDVPAGMAAGLSRVGLGYAAAVAVPPGTDEGRVLLTGFYDGPRIGRRIGAAWALEPFEQHGSLVDFRFSRSGQGYALEVEGPEHTASLARIPSDGSAPVAIAREPLTLARLFLDGAGEPTVVFVGDGPELVARRWSAGTTQEIGKLLQPKEDLFAAALLPEGRPLFVRSGEGSLLLFGEDGRYERLVAGAKGTASCGRRFTVARPSECSASPEPLMVLGEQVAGVPALVATKAGAAYFATVLGTGRVGCESGTKCADVTCTCRDYPFREVVGPWRLRLGAVARPGPDIVLKADDLVHRQETRLTMSADAQGFLYVGVLGGSAASLIVLDPTAR